jgi:hypothetical protein
LITVSGTKAGKPKPVVAAVPPGKIDRAALAGTYSPDDEGARHQIERSPSMEHNAGRFVEDATSVRTYLAFPLPEVMTKKHCSGGPREGVKRTPRARRPVQRLRRR